MTAGYLLDTQAFVIAITRGLATLPKSVREILSRPESRLHLSLASLWEMAIKIELGKLDLGAPLPEAIAGAEREAGVSLLRIDPGHLYRAQTLSKAHTKAHKDPFDRLIASQSLVEGLPILSADRIFDRYGCTRIWDKRKGR